MKKLLALLLVVVMMLSVVACGTSDGGKDTAADTAAETAGQPSGDDLVNDKEGSAEPVALGDEYVRRDEEEAYVAALGKYEELLNAAEATEDVNERFVLFAQAEAALLDSAVMLPTTTQNGAYTISRIAPRTVPYVQWGNDDDRLKGLIISGDDFLTPDERADLFALWDKAVAGEGEYDPKAYLEEKGHKIATTYTTTFSTAPVTIDWLNTSSQSDTEITVNCVDGLVEYNNLNQMKPALAESWEVSEDGTVYTFKIREGVYWMTAEGTKYAELTAKDFEAGFRHMLDTKAGLEWLIDGIVVGGTDYYANGGAWEDVGYKAIDDYTLEITLEKPTSYFMTMLTYSCFLPMCDQFFQANGGVYGGEEFAEASAKDTYKFGLVSDVANQVYCGPFLLKKLVSDSEILIEKNPEYYKPEDVNIDSVKWVYDNGENMTAFYKDVCDGVYAGCGLTQASGTLDMAKEDGNFDKYNYISETTSTTYFGGLNLARGTFALESGACATAKDEKAKISTDNALNNKYFRKALCYGFDRAAWNATSRGEDLKTTNMRNMYTHPQFVSLTEAYTDAEGHEFPAGTFYGDMVQYYCDKLGLNINVADGVDGWYNVELAQKYLDIALQQLDGFVELPIQIDVVYYSASDANVAQAEACKQVIERDLGADKVQVNLIEATTSDDYYACGYRAPNGEAGNFDFFYGSGWGPDYGDPSTYLDTFKGYGAGYMTKVIGLF